MHIHKSHSKKELIEIADFFRFPIDDLEELSKPDLIMKMKEAWDKVAERIPDFDTKIKLDTKFIFTFIKGKTALSEADTFSILDNDGKVEVVIGYSSINTNRITIPVDAESSGLKDIISFNADLFKEILTANKECTTAVLEVSNDGLARIVFNVNDFKSVYYLVATQGVD